MVRLDHHVAVDLDATRTVRRPLGDQPDAAGVLRLGSAPRSCPPVALHRRHEEAGNGEEDYMLAGRFLDRFERRGRAWRILFRRGLNEIERVDAAADRTLASADPETRGRRKPDDPLYAMLAQFHCGDA